MKTEYEYIHFVKIEDKVKSSVWSCRNSHSGMELGIVRWYWPWRQYCYFPNLEAIYSGGCLRDIDSFIAQLKSDLR